MSHVCQSVIDEHLKEKIVEVNLLGNGLVDVAKLSNRHRHLRYAVVAALLDAREYPIIVEVRLPEVLDGWVGKMYSNELPFFVFSMNAVRRSRSTCCQRSCDTSTGRPPVSRITAEGDFTIELSIFA